MSQQPGGGTESRSSDEAQYRPLIYRAAQADEQRELERLQSACSGRIRRHDTFRQQLEGLLRSRHPRRAPTPEELQRELEQYAGGRPLAELGVWVHYPWRDCLVHLLDEADFIELR